MFVTIDPGPVYAGSMCVSVQKVSTRVILAASGDSNSEKDESDTKKRDLVITPGGPRPAEQVHRVEPGQKVQRNPDGTYSVVPDTTPDSNKEVPLK
jgi:hypothetical protein